MPRSKQSSQPLRFSDPAVCALIIAGTGYDDSGAKNKYNQLKSRAIPNERLTRAFDIDNSFTTIEHERHREFKLQAGKAMKMTVAKVGTTTVPRKSSFSSFHKLQFAFQEHRGLSVGLLFRFNALGTPSTCTVSPKSNTDINIV